MPTVFDVATEPLIKQLATYLKENIEEVAPPSWAFTAKTGAFKEHPPSERDWWYIRCASLLRKLYVKAPSGISRLRKEYGGRARKGRRLEHTYKGSGSAIRDPLQQLQKAGLVEIVDKKGRRLSKEGRRLLDKIATDLTRKNN